MLSDENVPLPNCLNDKDICANITPVLYRGYVRIQMMKLLECLIKTALAVSILFEEGKRTQNGR